MGGVAMFGKRRLACSFCGKGEGDVNKLVAGPRVYICDACVAIASRLMDDHGEGGARRVVQDRGVLKKLQARLSKLWHGRTVVALEGAGQ